MIEQRLFRCDEDDPNRCQAVHTNQQCPFLATETIVDGKRSIYCARHEGASKVNDKGIRNYRLTKWQSRLNDFVDSDQIKGLREEIGILRIVLEEILNKCQDSHELLLYSSKIGDTAMKIEKLVSSCHRLEFSAGSLLDKSALLQLASVTVTIISKYISDASTLDAISNEIIEMIAQSGPMSSASDIT